jgi:trk system potassium uptake protein TrkH
VGLSVGIVSPNLHILGKVVLIIEMWVGRLEILPVIMFLQKIARKA